MKGRKGMTIEEAIAVVEKANEGLKIGSILDIGKAFVFGLVGQNGEELDIPPCSVDKETGELETFFPPDHLDELAGAEIIEL